MREYLIKVLDPNWGLQPEICAQGANAIEALENALGLGNPNNIGMQMSAFVTNTETGLTFQIDYVFG